MRKLHLPYEYKRYGLIGFFFGTSYIAAVIANYLTNSNASMFPKEMYFGFLILGFGIVELLIYYVFVKSIDSDGVSRSYTRKDFYSNKVDSDTLDRIKTVYNSKITKIENTKIFVAIIAGTLFYAGILITEFIHEVFTIKSFAMNTIGLIVLLTLAFFSLKKKNIE